MTFNISIRNLLAGSIFVAIGAIFAYGALNYELGSAVRMGPGYFPIVLSVLLIVLGGAIAIPALFSGPDEIPLGNVPWFGLFLLVAALVFFGATVRGLGLLPSLFVAVFMSAYASSLNTIVSALSLAAFMTVLCWLLFVQGLGLTLILIGPWLAF